MELGQPVVNAGWEERLARMKDVLTISIDITRSGEGAWFDKYDDEPITDEEYDRLEPKFEQVRELAVGLAWNMVKGTIKYSHDTYSTDTWFALLIDDALDVLNYAMLARKAYSTESTHSTC